MCEKLMIPREHHPYYHGWIVKKLFVMHYLNLTVMSPRNFHWCFLNFWNVCWEIFIVYFI
jgi:hypothetical protein